MASKITKGILISCWIVYLAILGAVVMVFMAIANGSIGYMPPVEQLENPIDKYASQVISSDGKALGAYAHSKDNRIYVNYEDLSPDLVKALIATEDIRFAEHSGIDAQGLFRAIVKRGILMQKSGGGGSTITQQLAKQLFSPSADNMMERLFQKPIEWVIAVQLERYYTKEEIINMYLNKFDFLYNAVGIQSASRVYFGKTPKTLKIEEAATLVGMCKNPSYFNPVRHNKRTIGRRNTVLEQMEKAGYITKAECDSLKALPLVVHFTRMDHKDGLAPYFREYLRLTMTAKKPERKDYASWQSQKFSEDSLSWATNPLYGWCNKNKKADGEYYNLYTDGLKIYTSIDSRMQKYAEDAVREHMSKDLQPAFFREKKGRSYAPFSRDVSVGQVDTMLMRAMHQTDRYRAMKKSGMAEADMRKEFEKPVDMRVFSWDGPIDTIMSPLDSIRYHKSFLRTAFMSMDPRTGQVKAYVGGIDYNDFQYDMVNGGRRQIGSTMKPFLYSLAMIEGISPCDQMLHVQQQLMDENGRLWVPRNASAKRIGEMVTIKWGLQNSDNWVTAYLMSQLSPYTFVRLLHSHIAHLGMAVKLHAFFRILVFSCYTEIRSFADSGYRTNGQLSIKFINRRNSFDFQKYTFFNLRKQIRELVIAGKHLDHDRVGKVGHGKHDDCLFVPDLTGIKADHLSPESNLTHLSGNCLQLDRHIIKVPSIDYVRVIGALERIIPTHKASLATFEPTGLSCKFLLFRSLRFLLFLFILRT